MKRNELRGAGTVFRYTVQQHYKTLSVRIFLAVLLILSLAAFPLIRMFSGGGDILTETDIKVLYLCDEMDAHLDHADILADERFSGIRIEDTDQSLEELRKLLADDPAAAAVVITTTEDQKGFSIKGYYGADGEVTYSDVSTLLEVTEDALHQALLRLLDTEQGQLDLLNTKVYSQVSTVSDYLAGDLGLETDTATYMFANMFYAYSVLLLGTLAMSYIVQLCMEEKVSKLVESLMVSVRPAALLTGKILAATLFVLGGLGLFAAGLIISYQLAKATGDVSFIRKFLVSGFDFDPSALHIGAGALLLFIICVLLAFFIFAFFSGIVGSCCSKTEDTQQASLAVVLFVMIGYMAASIIPALESDAVNYFCALFPLTSMFTALPGFLCGKIPLVIFMIALLLQAVTVWLLARAAGAVYRMMLLYRGGFPKPGQLIKMLKENRAAEKAAAKKEAGSNG